MYIKAVNNLDKVSERTFLSSISNAGGTTLAVRNTNPFTASWGIQIGETGNEQSEVVMLHTAIPSGGTALHLAQSLTYNHPADTPVYAIKYNKVIFKRSTDGTSGTATPLTNGTVTITADSINTQFDDTSGASSYAYKAAFYNSVLDVTSDDSDWITPAGYSFYSLAKIRERIKGKLFNSDFINDDATINDWINEWKEKMDNVAIDVNKDYSLGTTEVSFTGTSELGTITTQGFKDIRRVWLTSDGNSFYQATKMAVNSYDPNQTFSSTHPYYYMLGDNIIGRKPADGNGTARIVYYKFNTPLVNDTDELPVVMQNYTKSFIDYGHAQALYMDDKITLARSKEQSALGELERFRNEIASRLKSGGNYIQLVEDVSGEDLMYW